MIKRLTDIAVASLLLVLLAPVMLLIAVLVRLSSPGPALFRQVRVGRYGADFRLLKFRTMRQREGAERGAFDAGDTSRVTPLGRLLRATKLDELPQLWNVLAGQMSLVGPRPEVRKWVEAYPERWAAIHRVRPGMTDPASIAYRNEELLLRQAKEPDRTYREQLLPDKLRLYEQYIDHRSWLLDCRILWQTLVAVVRPETGGDPSLRSG